MVKDLQKPLDSLTSDIQVPETCLKVDEAKPVTTDQKPPNPEKSASRSLKLTIMLYNPKNQYKSRTVQTNGIDT